MQSRARQLRSQIGVTTRLRPDDTEAIDDLRREFGAARLEEYIQKTLSTFPPLTAEQRSHLAALLVDRRVGGAKARPGAAA